MSAFASCGGMVAGKCRRRTLELHVERSPRSVFEVVDDDNAVLLRARAAEGDVHEHEEPRLLHLAHADFAVVCVARQKVYDGAAGGVGIDLARRRQKQDKGKGKAGDNVGIEGERKVVIDYHAGECDKALRCSFDVALAAGEEAARQGLDVAVCDAGFALEGFGECRERYGGGDGQV